MARPKRLAPDQDFIARLSELSGKLGSQAELAKQAGLAPTTIQNYFEGGEPARRALIALAAAGDVSVEWLTTGRGAKSPGGFPEGYVTVPFFDLHTAGYTIYPFVNAEVMGFVMLRRAWLERSGVSMEKLDPVAFEAASNVLDGAIRGGDLVVMDRRRGLRATPGTKPGPGDLHIGGIYVVALEAHIWIGRIASRSKSLVVEIDGRQTALDPNSHNFQVMGPVIWRGGAIP